ncbi:MAG TPA: phosphoenolpyruvate carboxylase [Acidobacteria bacterium]|nr:phosphoenolpyruvate carboxylase [Acidobacteriota bacterium]
MVDRWRIRWLVVVRIDPLHQTHAMLVAVRQRNVGPAQGERPVQTVGTGFGERARRPQRSHVRVAEHLVVGKRPVEVANVQPDIRHRGDVHVGIWITMGGRRLDQLVQHAVRIREEHKPIARHAVGLGQELHALRPQVRDVSGERKLLAGNPELRQALDHRAPFLDPLSYLQVELLARKRTGRQAKAEMRSMLDGPQLSGMAITSISCNS